MKAIKIRVAKCREHNHWLVSHDTNILQTAIDHPHAITIADYWAKAFPIGPRP